MLCYHQGHGDICTNRCSERPDCKNQKVPFLIEAADRLVDEAYSGEIAGLNVIIYKTNGIAPQAFINGVIDVINNNPNELLLS